MKYSLFKTSGNPTKSRPLKSYFGVSITIESNSEWQHLTDIKEWCISEGFSFAGVYFYFDSEDERVEFILRWL